MYTGSFENWRSREKKDSSRMCDRDDDDDYSMSSLNAPSGGGGIDASQLDDPFVEEKNEVQYVDCVL